MSGADNQTLALRDLAVAVVKAKGVLISETNAQSLYMLSRRALAH